MFRIRSLWPLRWALGAGLVLTLALFLGSGSVESASPGFTLGRENTWFRVQNLGSVTAAIGAAYLDESGAVVAPDINYSVQPGRSAPPFYQAGNSALPRGFRGSSTIVSDQKTGALLVRSIMDTQTGLLRLGAVTATRALPAKRIYLPLVYRNFGHLGAWNTRLIVMNTSATRAACIGIAYWRAGGSTPAREPADFSQCISIPPLGTIRRDVSDMTVLGDQWLGSVMVDVVGAEESPGSKQIIVANAETWNRDRGTFASYTGLCWRYPDPCRGVTGASSNVLLPLIYRAHGFRSQWHTYLMIQTHNAVTKDVRIDFKGTVDGAPFETSYGPFTVNTSRICYLASTDLASACAEQTSNGPLPEGFVGSAIVREPTDSIPLAVVAHRVSNRADNHSAYSGFMTGVVQNAAGPPYQVYLPLIYRTYGWHGPTGNAKGWNSWFQVQVTDGSTAQLDITYYSDSGAVAATQSVTMNGSAAVGQFGNPSLGGGFIGSAVIQSDKPIAVVATITSDAYLGDADASYEASGP